MIASSLIPEITDDSFELEVLKAPGATLVKFWAEWCPPCRLLSPVLEQIAAEAHPDFRIVSINSDENPLSAARLRVLALPTMILFRSGEPLRTIVGTRPAAVLRTELADVLVGARL